MMNSFNKKDIDLLIQEVDRNGTLTLGLTKAVSQALEKIKLRRVRNDKESEESEEMSDEFIIEKYRSDEGDDGGSTDDESTDDEAERNLKRQRVGKSDESASEEGPAEGREYGVEGWGYKPLPHFDAKKITAEREQEIRDNPWQYIEFVYQNRRFKLKPIGTIEPVPKRIYFGSSGAPYYYKTRDADGKPLSMAKWTKVYLKRYQKRQCFQGRSARGTGLAGYIDVDGECLNVPPPNGRRTAARPSKHSSPRAARDHRPRHDKSRRKNKSRGTSMH
jgi:hypothetical protein